MVLWVKLHRQCIYQYCLCALYITSCCNNIWVIFHLFDQTYSRVQNLIGGASKRRKHSPCVGLIATLPDTASLVFRPSPLRSAYNWLQSLWIQSCSSSNRNHLFAVEVSSESRKSVSHLWIAALSFCPLSLFLSVYRRITNRERLMLLVLQRKTVTMFL